MRYRLDLTLRQAEGALARVLGTAERRGFRPVAVDGAIHAEGHQPDGDRWHLRMTVEGLHADRNHAGQGLQQQLAKLHDCVAVELQPCP